MNVGSNCACCLQIGKRMEAKMKVQEDWSVGGTMLSFL